MKFVLFLRALLFSVLATSLAAGFPVQKRDEETGKPIVGEAKHLTQPHGHWTTPPSADKVSRFLLSHNHLTYFAAHLESRPLNLLRNSR